MDGITDYDASLHSGEPESDFNTRDSETTEKIIKRFARDVACICEKLNNLSLLSMHVEMKESDFETFVSDVNPDLVITALEYALLSGFLDSEVKLLEPHISHLQMEKDSVIQSLFSKIHIEESLTGMEEILHDSEKALELLLEQVLDIKTRSANFEKNLLRLCGGEDYTESLNGFDQVELNEKMNMHTVESHREVLRMLDKSLKTEIYLDKRVNELTEVEERLTMRLRLLEQEVVYAEEEAEMTLEKFYETDHTSELLTEICKELISKIKMLQFNLRGSVQRESQLKSDLLKLRERSTEDRASTEGIMERISTTEYSRAQIIEAEEKCQLLKDANEKVVSLETELSDVKVKLRHAETCYEASRDEKSLLLSTIKDMDNVIEDLKNKVTQGNVQTENMTDRCFLLFESNSYLKNELNLVKSKVKSLETSLHQMEETKNAFARNVNLRSKLISDLVMQMTLERERIQNQISSLKQENNMLVNHLKKTNKDPAVKYSYGDIASSFTTESKEALSAIFEVEKSCNKTAREIDARQPKTKFILLVLIILVIPLLGVLLYQTQVKHIL